MKGDLISRDAAIQMLREKADGYTASTFAEQGDYSLVTLATLECAADVQDIPAVDAETIIRCRDCKHWDNDKHWNNDVAKAIYAGLCSYIGLTTGCEFYCAKGERDGGAEES